MIGDSLQVGTGPYLEQQLGALPVESDDRQSRRSSEGLEALQARLRPDHDVVVFDMGTNDDPSNPNALYANLQAARAATGDRCPVVATILRPPYKGVTVEGMNAAVERFASTTRACSSSTGTASPPARPGSSTRTACARPEGHALRGRLIADAVRSCGGGGEGSRRRRAKANSPPVPEPEPVPLAEVDVEVEPPAPLVAIAGAVRTPRRSSRPPAATCGRPPGWAARARARRRLRLAEHTIHPLGSRA